MTKKLSEETRRSLFDLLRKAGLRGKVSLHVDLENETAEYIPHDNERILDIIG